MADKLIVEIEARELIKSSAPTPPHLAHFKFSLLDQVAPQVYVPLVFFYSGNGETSSQRSQLLKSSLSEALSLFYPFAGRIKDRFLIDCCNEGAEFVEAWVNCPISDILRHPNPGVLEKFLPVGMDSPPGSSGPLLVVQASFFECGGMAIGLCFSHKIADAATFSAFVKAWAAIASKSGLVESPEFTAASVFPPGEFTIEADPEKDLLNMANCVPRRFVFPASKMEALKARTASKGVHQPTRVEAVTGLIWESATAASRSLKGSKRQSAIAQAVNLRKRVVPPISENTIGNLAAIILAKSEKSDPDASSVLIELRKRMEELLRHSKGKLGGNDAASFIFRCLQETGELFTRGEEKGVDFYQFTSWCRFPLYEAADFGWGKPKWVTGNPVVRNVIVLMDTEDGQGIEALVPLSEREMELFEGNQELLEFASFNPAILF